MAAIGAALTTGGGLVVSGAAVGVTATALYFKSTTKVMTEEAATISFGRFGKAIMGKIALGVSVAFVVADIVGFIASSALWYQYQKELADLRAKELKYFQASIDLNADAGYLNNMEKNFKEVLQQGSEVVAAFQGLQKKWQDVRQEIDKVDNKLKDLSTSLASKLVVEDIEKNLTELNTGFSILEDKLKKYELNFALPTQFIENPKAITATDKNATLLRGPATRWLPSALYSAYVHANRFNS